MWAFCDAKDDDHTLYLGKERNEEENRITLHKLNYEGTFNPSQDRSLFGYFEKRHMEIAPRFQVRSEFFPSQHEFFFNSV